MTRSLKDKSVEQLVKEFTALAIQQYDAHLENDIAKVTRLYWQIDSLKEELKARPGDQRAALLPLYGHTNLQVRLKAALATLAIAPQAARQQLEEISASNIQPQAGDAGMSLSNLDAGIFKPK